MEIPEKNKNPENSDVTGLDKIKKIEENNKVDIKGLDMIISEKMLLRRKK